MRFAVQWLWLQYVVYPIQVGRAIKPLNVQHLLDSNKEPINTNPTHLNRSLVYGIVILRFSTATKKNAPDHRDQVHRFPSRRLALCHQTPKRSPCLAPAPHLIWPNYLNRNLAVYQRVAASSHLPDGQSAPSYSSPSIVRASYPASVLKIGQPASVR